MLAQRVRPHQGLVTPVPLQIPVQHDVVAMGNITWLWMKRHQFVTVAEREFNVSSILIEDLCAAGPPLPSTCSGC